MSFLFRLCFILLLPILLFASSTELKIAISKNIIPYSYIDSSNQANGILVDYWKLWAKKTNTKVHFIPMSWDDGLKAIKEKRVHIHSGLFINEERKKYINYLSPIFYSKAHFYINKDDEDRIQTVKDLDFKKVGLIKGTFFDSYVANNFKNIKIKRYRNQNEMVADINNKEIDAVITDSLVAWLQGARSIVLNKRIKLEDFELRNWFHAGVIKGNKELEVRVLKGIEQITQEEIIELEKKWVLNEELRHFDKKNNPYKLTIVERNWLRNNPDASIATVKDWDLFSFMDEDKKLKGFHLDLLKLINKNLNTNIKYKLYDGWKEAFNSTKTGKSKAIFGLSWSKEREEFFYYTPTYYYDPFYVVTRKDRDDINRVEDFEGKTLVTEKDHIINEEVKKRVNKVNFLYRYGSKTILEAIQSGKADGAVMGNVSKHSLEKYDLKITKQIITSAGKLAIGVYKGEPTFKAIIDKGIKSLTKAQLDELKEKWLSVRIKFSVFTKEEQDYIKNNPELVVGVDSWAPFYFVNGQGEIDGIVGEFLKKIFTISKLKVKVEAGEWSILLQKFKNKEIDMLPGVFYSNDREKFGKFGTGYFDIRTSIFIRAEDEQKISSFKDLAGKKLGITKGDARVKDIKRLYKNIKVVETKNLDDGIFRLMNKELDAIADVDLSVEYIIQNSLITGLKSVPQNDIKSKTIHMFTQKENRLLHSILERSLKSIQAREKSEITDKWLSKKVKKDVNIALGKSFEPYVITKGYLKGIEYDLVKKILSKDGIVINKSKNITHEQKVKGFEEDNNLDMIVAVKQKEDEYYYSDDFISFDNVVVSRVEDSFFINSLEDLKGKKVLGFTGAKEIIGKEFEKFANNSLGILYDEITSQKEQVRLFLDKKVDVIILDKNIFRWYLKRLSSDEIERFKLDYIFPSKNSYKVAFKNKTLRNVFNKNLDFIKKSGEYEEVFYNYIQSYIESKIEINSLFVALFSKYIYENDIKSIENIINVLSSLEYIRKIEVFNNESKLLATTTSVEFFKYSSLDSFYFNRNIPQKVGYINVYFDEIKLKEHVNNNTLIPKLDNFRKLEVFPNIKTIYKRFGYLNENIQLTNKEKEFISNNPIITFSEINWKPLSIIDEGRFTGLFWDYMKIIEEKTGLQFRFLPASSWPDVLEKFKQGELDFIPSISGTKKEQGMGNVSSTYTSFNFAIVTNKDGIFMDDLSNLEGKTVAIPRGYTSYNLVKDNYPKIKLIGTTDIKEALTLVSKKQAYAFVGHSAVAVYNIKNYFPDLKIVGVSQELFNHHFLMQNDMPELLSIVNKVIDSISLQQKEAIKDKWIRTEINTAVDYTILYRTIIGFSFILAIVLVFTNKLSKAKKEIERTNQKLKDNMNELVSTQKKLIESEKMASLAGLVAGVAHEVNTPVGIGVTGTTHLIETTSKLRDDYKNQKMSQEAFEKYIESTDEIAHLINTNLEKTVRLVRNFKQIASDQATEEKREFKLLDYTNKILLSLGNMTKNKNLNIAVECDKELVVNSYPGPYSQIITNLIINSIRHGFQDNLEGKILITISKVKDEIVLVYNDDGRGIPKENLDKIFEPFFTTNREKGGTGLGLNIIYNIVTNTLKGTIVCNSQIGEGVEFIIRFKE